ncbi:hypothetical protein MOK15_02885 [Sphingobium sp. BYY-5]|uniref:helix-turn-helix transcriptional regulator n=1 Tax=Sphingobium sp. BYY-5 TaxID=2926400 RepID=UPI001FA805E6|nr:hypothetical protein [Sphingobium sp. BYY-5]MCI4589053.1 hypothetical protein [Sphingobium sp. BYY-5]
MPDLSQLNDGERDILRLFAQGHTAKSVATLTGKSVGSINERLREARRKTGVGSSRALSRLLADQENRDMFIGVDPAGQPIADLPEAVGPSRSALFRGTVMIAIVTTTALAAGVFFMQATTPAAPDATNPAKDDPLLAGSFWGPTPSQRYVMLRQEKRDPAWADATERALIARYAVLLRKYGIEQPVRALCGETQCEIALKADITASQAAKLTEELQDQKLAASLAKIGLTGATAAFGGPGNSYLHSAYWTRVKPKS